MFYMNILATEERPIKKKKKNALLFLLCKIVMNKILGVD